MNSDVQRRLRNRCLDRSNVFDLYSDRMMSMGTGGTGGFSGGTIEEASCV